MILIKQYTGVILRISGFKFLYRKICKIGTKKESCLR